MKKFNAIYDSIRTDHTMQVAVHGSLTSVEAIQFKNDLIKRITSSDENFLIDLRGLNAMDVTGVNALVMAHNKIQKLGRKMTLLSNSANAAYEFLHLTKFMEHFEFRRA